MNYAIIFRITMNRVGIFALLFCWQALSGGFIFGQSTFVNFETSPVHPVAMSPNGARLAVCNLPDGRVELFDLTTEPPVHLSSVVVGVDPVTVRFRNDEELWVV